MNEESQIPTHLDLFSGIGGFARAFEAEGFKTIGFAEIDPYASAVLQKHWPNVVNYGDVRNVPRVRCDVLTGGFPCQPCASMGRRKGAGDVRWLWPTMCDVIEASRCSFVVGENVDGIVELELDGLLSDLESIGYTGQPFNISACCVGTTIIRKRVFVVAVADSFDGKSGMGNFAKRTQPVQRTGAAECFPIRLQTARRLIGDVDGVSERFYKRRVHAIGNSIVPQVAQEIARCIYQCLTT
jgi:DNA (cytosine-5)-methyltransferase 1